MQMNFLVYQLKKDFPAVWRALTTAKSVREASNEVLLKFERPKDQGEKVQKTRASYGQKYYDQYASKPVPTGPEKPGLPELPKTFKPYKVQV
jgi:hypothetical protein